MTDEDIAIAGDWDADPKGFCQALKDVAFFDGDSGSYSIHDWADHQPYAAGRGERSELARNAVNKRWEYERNTPRINKGIRTEYASDTPNQSKPIQTNPNHLAQAPSTGTRIPENFAVTQAHRQFATEKGYENPDSHIDAFRDYWRGVPGAKGKKLDWDATFRVWLSRNRMRASPDFQPPKKLNPNLYREQ